MKGYQPPSHDHLFSRETPPSEVRHLLTSWAWAIPNAMRAYSENMRRRQSPLDVLKSAASRKEKISKHVLEGLQFAGELTLSHIMANGLRAGIVNYNLVDEGKHPLQSVFGMDLTYAANHSDFPDHGVPHWRRMHRLMEIMAQRIPELRHNVSIRRWLNAWMLFPHFHDIDQLLVVFQNKRENKNYNSKKGHALAAAVMIMALTERYMEEAGMTAIDRAEARQITAAAALMMMKHDEPEKLKEAFSEYIYVDGRKTNLKKYQGNDSRYILGSLEETNKALLEDFEQNNVELFSLSPRQIMRILGEQKSQAGLVEGNNNRYGLYKPFYEEYEKNLADLYNDVNPLLGKLTPEERKSFILATEAAVIADEMEMIYPPYPSILRSLKTHISTTRTWWNSNGMTSKQMYDNIKSQGGNYKGDIFNCDVRRLLWEAWQLTQTEPSHSDEFELKNSPFVKKTNKDHIIMRLLALKKFGTAIMTNQHDATIDHIYTQRIDALGKKAMKRAGLNPKGARSEAIYDLLLREAQDTDLAVRYGKRKKSLEKEADEMKLIIAHKPISEGGRNAVGKFEELCDLVLKDVCKTYHVSDKEVKRLASQLENNASAFYETYDSLGGLPDTLLEPENPELWNSLLQDEYTEEQYLALREETLNSIVQLQHPN